MHSIEFTIVTYALHRVMFHGQRTLFCYVVRIPENYDEYIYLKRIGKCYLFLRIVFLTSIL